MKNYMDLTGRVAIVTGASSGLGYEYCKALAENGAKVAAFARRKEKLEKLAADFAAGDAVYGSAQHRGAFAAAPARPAADALRQYVGVRFSGAGSFFHPNPSTAQGGAGLFAAAARKGISADFAAKLIQRVTPCKRTDMCRPSGNCCIKRGLTIR